MQNTPSNVVLREVQAEDLPLFFEHQQDPEANYMAAFTARDPADQRAFVAHWTRILGDQTNTIRTILFEGQVAGSVSSYEETAGHPEVTYWLGKPYWGQGIATAALRAFLVQVTARPIYARVAKDNLGSLRVLEKCGFTIVGEDRGFANARGQEIEEWLLQLG
jgi:RimJ/RimL family protein N-acetyltransferase